MKVNEEIETI
ncbi:Hypothetical protein SSCIU_00843 [Mammaliicoccus sciuri]|nr:Hypothetical protein SSCIU_00843 [Mammaliicoccus sciuri]